MRILVREKTTKQLLANDLTWGGGLEKAKCFPSSADAMLLCIKEDMHEVEIVLQMGRPEFDIVLEVNKESSAHGFALIRLGLKVESLSARHLCSARISQFVDLSRLQREVLTFIILTCTADSSL